MLNRRAILAAGGAFGLLPSACGTPRTRRGGDVLAAGQPAALLIWATARDRLAGWPRRPPEASLRALPPAAADLPELGALSTSGRPANLEAVAALKPALVIDYGDVDLSNRAQGDRMRERLGVEWRLIDGTLARIPDAFRQAGALLDATAAGEALAGRAEVVLERWRAAPAGPGFYYARGADGLETGFRGALATEVLEGAGWTNVAVGSDDIGRVTLEQVVAWDPEALVTLDPGFARRARETGAWRRRRDGSLRRILLIPDTPFGWIDRPPSVNRLLGCAWLADPADGVMELTLLSRRLYGMAEGEVVRPRWIS